jgi:peptidoglycan/xylan/chitin deacetylase (PgdA/CDA1 family)
MDINESDLAAHAGLYLTGKQLRDLKSYGFEIGNHTLNHVNCRSLAQKEFVDEIDENKALLEAVGEVKVRSFSVPYGSSDDLTNDLRSHLQASGHEAIFLAEGCANNIGSDSYRLNRISTRSRLDAAFFSEIEVLPRLRAWRNQLRGNLN